jgi:hypothetical protein
VPVNESSCSWLDIASCVSYCCYLSVCDLPAYSSAFVIPIITDARALGYWMLAPVLSDTCYRSVLIYNNADNTLLCARVCVHFSAFSFAITPASTSADSMRVTTRCSSA